MIPNISKNKIRDFIKDDLYRGYAREGSTAPTLSDTSLELRDLATENELVNTVSNKTINSLYIIYSNQGNTKTYNEIALKYSDGTLFNRIVFPDFNKTSGVELHTTVLTRIT